MFFTAFLNRLARLVMCMFYFVCVSVDDAVESLFDDDEEEEDAVISQVIIIMSQDPGFLIPSFKDKFFRYCMPSDHSH